MSETCIHISDRSRQRELTRCAQVVGPGLAVPHRRTITRGRPLAQGIRSAAMPPPISWGSLLPLQQRRQLTLYRSRHSANPCRRPPSIRCVVADPEPGACGRRFMRSPKKSTGRSSAADSWQPVGEESRSWASVSTTAWSHRQPPGFQRWPEPGGFELQTCPAPSEAMRRPLTDRPLRGEPAARACSRVAL